ncbi:LysR substrate-binding domain-containing protein, partial [Rhizobium ruizarguesonis]
LYPSIALDFSFGERIVDMIEDGYDLVMRTVPPPDSSLVARKLTPWRHMLVFSPAYFESHRRIELHKFADDRQQETHDGAAG